MPTESFRFGRIDNFASIPNLSSLANTASGQPSRQVSRNGRSITQVIRESYENSSYLYMRFATEDADQVTTIDSNNPDSDDTEPVEPRYVSDILLYDSGYYGYISRNGGSPHEAFDLVSSSSVSYTSGLSMPSNVLSYYYNNYDQLKSINFNNVDTSNISTNLGQIVDKAKLTADDQSASDLRNVNLVSQLYTNTTTDVKSIKVKNQNSNNRKISQNGYVSLYFSDESTPQVRSTTIDNAISPVINRFP